MDPAKDATPVTNAIQTARQGLQTGVGQAASVSKWAETKVKEADEVQKGKPPTSGATVAAVADASALLCPETWKQIHQARRQYPYAIIGATAAGAAIPSALCKGAGCPLVFWRPLTCMPFVRALSVGVKSMVKNGIIGAAVATFFVFPERTVSKLQEIHSMWSKE